MKKDWKLMSQRAIPAPDIMPKTNPRAIPYFVRGMLRKDIPSCPDVLPQTNPMRRAASVGAPEITLTTILAINNLPP
jgi:hypothetical protein